MVNNRLYREIISVGYNPKQFKSDILVREMDTTLKGGSWEHLFFLNFFFAGDKFKS